MPYQISNEAVFGFSRTMRDHGSPSVGLCQVVSVNRFRNTANLVDLQEKAIAGLLLYSKSDSLWIGDCQVVSDDLDVHGPIQGGPSFPVVLENNISG
jgi:hypothetical protein